MNELDVVKKKRDNDDEKGHGIPRWGEEELSYL
jgi:hypothetical protein